MHPKRFELTIPAIPNADVKKLQRLNFTTLLDTLGGILSTAIIDDALLSKKPMPIEFLLQGMPFAGADIRQQLHLFSDYLNKKYPDSGTDVKATIATIELNLASFSDLRTDLVSMKADLDDIAQADFLLALYGNVEAADRLAGYAVSMLDDAPLMLPFSIGLQKHAHRVTFRTRNGGAWEWRAGIELEILEAGCQELSTYLGFLAGSVQSMSAWMRGLHHDRGAASERARSIFDADLTQSMISDAYKRSIAKPDDTYRAEDQLIVTDAEIEASEAEWRAEAAATEAEIADEKEALLKKNRAAALAELKQKSVPLATDAEASYADDFVLNEPSVQVLEPINLTGVNVTENPILKAFAEIGGKKLPLSTAPHELAAVRIWLREMWPHAHDQIDAVLRDLVPGKPIKMAPFLLVGSPGAGKTGFLNVLAQALEMTSILYPCASVSDNSFGGTPSQWASRRGSVPAELIRTSMTANPVVILDELEKTGISDRNGSLVHALLPMLEGHTAAAYFEVGIERTIDLSNVNFWATANSLDTIPAPLRDRFRIIRMPDPGPEHVSSIAQRIVEKIDRQAGRDVRWTPPLAADEIDVIRRAWGGGSLRKLNRAVEATLSARAALRSWH